MELDALNKLHDRMEALGATSLAISPQKISLNRAFVEKHVLHFEILSDPDNRVAAAYGLRWTLPVDLRELYVSFGLDIPGGNGDHSWRLPMPARYVIDRAGVIRYASTDPDYTRRPEPEESLAVLETI